MMTGVPALPVRKCWKEPMTPKDQPRHGEVAPDPALARARDVAFEISCDLIGSSDAENFFVALNDEWERRLGHT